MALQAKHELIFEKPALNASGFLGFAPALQAESGWPLLGAFITNPISLRPRSPAAPPRLLPFPGGFLLHTGHPNPGLHAAARRFGQRWANSPLPILVHLLADDPDSLRETVQMLEQQEGVAGIEIGTPLEIDAAGVRDLARAAQGELPFIIQLPVLEAASLGTIAESAGAAAVSLGPLRGALPGPDGRGVSGRLYGPALFPLALEAVSRLGRLGIPVFAGGGVSSSPQARALMDAGAGAVLFDYVLWKPGGEAHLDLE